MRAGVHEREAGRDRRLLRPPPAARIRARGLPDKLAKDGAEGTEAPEADREADLGHGQRRVPQQLLGALDPSRQEASMRRLAEGPLKLRTKCALEACASRASAGTSSGSAKSRFNQILRTAKMNVNRNRVAHPPVAAYDDRLARPDKEVP